MTYLKILALHTGISCFLPIAKFDRVRRWLRARASSKTRRKVKDPQVIAELTRKSSYWIPGTSCLSEALCCQAVLLRNGYDAKMVIGLERGEKGKMEAHAWIELDGAVLIGDNGKLGSYRPLRDRRC